MDMKKIITLITAMCLMFSMISVGAVNVSSYPTYNGFEYTTDDISAKIVSYKGTEADLIVPETLGGKEVTCIGNNAFKKNNYIVSVKLPSKLKKIGDYAFSLCENLTKVTVPATLSMVGNFPFKNSGVTNVVFEEGTTKIPEGIFAHCDKLSDVTIPDTVTFIDSDAFLSCDSLMTIDLPDNLYRLYDGFSNCKNLESVVIPKSLNIVAGSPFSWSGLKTGIIEEGSTIVPQEIFYCCDKLTKVVIPNTVTSISQMAFSDCYSLEKIEIPLSVEHMGRAVFWNCTSLKEVVIPPSVTAIGDDMGDYLYSSMDNITIKGYEGTFIESYCKEKGYPFVSLGELVDGDADVNGVLNVMDATLVQKELAGLEKITKYQLGVADVNGDDVVSIIDVTEIQKMCVK